MKFEQVPRHLFKETQYWLAVNNRGVRKHINRQNKLLFITEHQDDFFRFIPPSLAAQYEGLMYLKMKLEKA